MFSTKEIPSPSSMLSAYSYIPASFRSIRSCFSSTFRYVFKRGSPQLTLVVDELNAMTGYQNQIPGGMMGNQMPMPMPMPGGMMRNQIYDASELYLSTKISPDTKRLQISKTPKDKNLTIRLENEEKIVDVYNGIKLKWRFVCVDPETKPPFPKPVKKSFELSFHQKHKDFVLNTYLPFLLDRAEAIKDEQRVLRMFTLNNFVSNWKSIDLENPANFETLAMEPDLKNAVMEDLNRFVKRKELYKGAGKAWKRGYLLYGPPRSGKSSLVVAMANYLKFDVYALQLANIKRESDLRRLLLSTRNRSILVIEDTDCRVDLHDPGHDEDSDEFSDDFDDDDLPVPGPPVAGRKQPQPDVKLTLSGVLNFIDGLWSSCGDERIIIFTTNHKDRLDPALLRPGRMDMHIHMSYCTAQGFKLLASNYLDIKGHHRLLGEIEGLLQNTEVTQPQIAEELMKSEDADIALEGLVRLLKRKKLEADEAANKAESRKQA